MTRTRLALVTGAAGFIGRHVCRALHAVGYQVLGVGRGSWSPAEAAGWGVERWLAGDVDRATLAAVCQGSSPDAFLHCAGGGAVSASYKDPYADFQNTSGSTLELLEFVRRSSGSGARVVLASSAAVYGEQTTDRLVEEAPRLPMSPYGMHKLTAEMLAESYSRFFGLHASVIRLFSVYGEGLRKQLLWDAARKIEAGQPSFFGTGGELRDWIHVSDAATLLVAAAVREQGAYEVYNGGNEVHDIRHVLARLANCMGRDAAPRFSGEVHAGNPVRLTSDSSRARRMLAWTPRVALDEGIARYARWFGDQE